MPEIPVIFDRALLARRRARAAASMTSADFLLKAVAEDFADRVSMIKRDFERTAVIGAHTGRVADALAALPSVGMVVRTERCRALIAGQPGAKLVCDEETLPFAPQSLNLVVSALTLQWVNDVPGALAQIIAALKPDGLFLGALPGGETLHELRLALTVAESEITGGVSPRISPFVDVRDLGALLQRAGFALPVTDSDRLVATYPGMFELMRDLRAMGATNVLAARSRSPLPRGVFLRASEIYAERFAGEDGRIPATFEIVTATGWRPDPSQQQALRPGSARKRLADALGTQEISLGEKTGSRS